MHGGEGAKTELVRIICFAPLVVIGVEIPNDSVENVTFIKKLKKEEDLLSRICYNRYEW